MSLRGGEAAVAILGWEAPHLAGATPGAHPQRVVSPPPDCHSPASEGDSLWREATLSSALQSLYWAHRVHRAHRVWGLFRVWTTWGLLRTWTAWDSQSRTTCRSIVPRN